MRRFAVLLAAWVVVCSSAWAQGARATLNGRVTDAQGAVVPGVDVTVTSDDTNVKSQTKTNEQGAWIVQFLVPGSYSVNISAGGFKSVERKAIKLSTGDSKQIDTQLEIGTATTQLTVTAETPLIDTTAAVSGTVIAQEHMLEMPSMSRVPTLLATLSPGVYQQDQNQNVAHLWSHDAASQFTVNGGRNNQRSNSYELDGMPNVKSGGQIAYVPPPDSLQEVKVAMNAYDAQIGRQAGGTIQMTLKSGTAKVHGSLYEFNQNNILNAMQFHQNLVPGSTKSKVNYNEYGATIGGPVWIPKVYRGTEKTFFFFNYNGIRNSDPRSGTRSLPTELERQGNFTDSWTSQVVGGIRQRIPIQVFDPLTVQGDANGTRSLFPGMIVPVSRQSKIAQNILSYIPLPNAPSDVSGNAVNNFVPRSNRSNKMANVTIRGDHIWNTNHKSFATVRWYHQDELAGVHFGKDDMWTGTYQHRMTRGSGIDHVWTISPSTVLNLKMNLTRYEEPNNDNGVGFDPATLGFPTSYTSQQFVQATPRITGIFGDIGVNQAGSVDITGQYTWSAVMTHVKGSHTIKYGSDFWVLQQANKNLGNQGAFEFGSNWTRRQAQVGGATGEGSTLASFLLGLPQGGNMPRNANAFWSQHFNGYFFQDDWRVTPRLTLNLGLRWDFETPVTERYNRATAYYDPTVENPISSAAQAAYAAILNNPANANNAGVQILKQVLPASQFRVMGVQLFNGVNGVPRGTQREINFGEVQPRFGFAYRIGPDTVLRGGVGRFSQASFITAGQNGFSRSTPFTATNDNWRTAVDTLENPFRGGILAPTGSSLGPLTNLGQGVNWTHPAPGRFHSWEYSLHLQHQIKTWLFEAGYTHNKTYDIGSDLNMNLPSFDLWKRYRGTDLNIDTNGRPLDQLLWDVPVPNPFRGLANVTGTIATNTTVAMNQLLNPVTLLGGITRNNNPWGENTFDALLAKVEKRFSKGFTVLNSFTWSKLIEDTSWTGPEIAGRNIEHKLGGEDRPFRLSVAPIWNLPVGRKQKLGGNMPKVLDAVVGGWMLSGQFQIQSGTPTVFGTDSFFSGQSFALPKDQQSLDKWFDTAQFVRFPARNTDISNYPWWTGIQSIPGYNYKPAAGDSITNGVFQSFATYIRNYPTRWANVRNSRVNNVDAVISKNWNVKESVRIQYRFEVYNAFNHVRFAGPNTDPTSSSFGVVGKTQQNNARLVQMALKIYY